MTLAELLELPILNGARVVAGREGLHRDVRWLHVVDLPDPVDWVGADHLLLTTGIAWPRTPGAERDRIRALARQGLAGLGMAVPQFFEHFSDTSRREADAAGLPLLEIAWEIPFAQITEEAHRAILAQQYRAVERSEAAHRALTRAAVEAVSLRELADTLGRLIDRHVVFEGADGEILASYAPGAALGGPRPPPGSADDPYAHAACPIRIHGEEVGRVCILAGGVPLSDGDRRAGEHAAVVAALHIAHQRQLASLEERLGHAFLDALLEGSFATTDQNLERARLAGFDVRGRYRVGVLALDEDVPLSRESLLRREATAERLRAVLVREAGVALVSVSLNRIAFLLPCGVEPASIWRPFGGAGSLGVGSCQQGVEGVRGSHQDAMAALRLATSPGLHRHEDFVVPRLLRGDVQAGEQLLAELFGGLEGARGGDTLRRSLLCWARHGFSQSERRGRAGDPCEHDVPPSRAGDRARGVGPQGPRGALQVAARGTPIGVRPQ